MKLFFVYNAQGGIVNNWLDIAHKILRPETYNCSLCALTHGSFREKRIWKNFRTQFSKHLEFYHKDEFEKKFRSKWLPKYDYPIVLKSNNEGFDIVLTAKEIDEIKTVEALIDRVREGIHTGGCC